MTEHIPGPATRPRAGTVLAFDFGEKRIGVAVGDFETGIAHPLATIASADNRIRFADIGKLIAEWRPVRLVVGLPAHMDGTEHEMSRLARRFAQRLTGRFGIPVDLFDERLSSAEAESTLRAAGVDTRKRKTLIDATAASEILRGYLSSSGEEAPGP